MDGEAAANLQQRKKQCDDEVATHTHIRSFCLPLCLWRARVRVCVCVCAGAELRWHPPPSRHEGLGSAPEINRPARINQGPTPLTLTAGAREGGRRRCCAISLLPSLPPSLPLLSLPPASNARVALVRKRCARFRSACVCLCAHSTCVCVCVCVSGFFARCGGV